MSDESPQSTDAPASAGEPTLGGEPSALPPPAPPGGPDRGRRIAFGIMGGLVVLGVVLIARSPREVREPFARGGDGHVARSPDAGVAVALDGGEPTHAAVALADAGSAPFVPVWRVASLKSDASLDVASAAFGKRTLAAALTEAGVGKTEIRRLVRAFDGVHRIEHPEHRGTRDGFVVAKDRASGVIRAFEYIASPTDVWQAKTDEASGDHPLVAKKLDLLVERKRTSAALSIRADLTKAIAAAGLPEDAASSIDDALDGHVDVSAIRSGVQIRVVGTEEWVERAVARYRVEALEYVPKSGTSLRVYFYERESGDSGRRHAPRAGFYDAKGQQPYRGAFRSPLPLARVTSRFNPKRLHPVLHVVMPHNGVDFGASSGAPVYASAPGSVATAGDGGPCGNMVQIEHTNGLTTAYCHLSRFAAGLHSGQHVEARQLIGYVGQTGRATGPHLHFAVKRRGAFIDPLGLKMDGVRVLAPSDREAFAKRRADLDAALDAIALGASVDAQDDKDDKDEPSGEE
jgi:murein DD-endopeptidase MepM/ murein hydrolase activator NlpD